MDKSLQKYYDNLFEMFNTEGWKQFQEDAQVELKTSTETADLVCTTNEVWQYRRGELSKLRQLVGFETFVKQSYDLTINEETQEGQD